MHIIRVPVIKDIKTEKIHQTAQLNCKKQIKN